MCFGGLIALLSGEVDATPDDDPEQATTRHHSFSTLCFTLISLFLVYQVFE